MRNTDARGTYGTVPIMWTLVAGVLAACAMPAPGADPAATSGSGSGAGAALPIALVQPPAERPGSRVISDARSLEAFLEERRIGWGDTVLVSGGTAEERAEALDGLSARLIAGQEIPASTADQPLTLTHTRVLAIPPRCGDWSADSTRHFHNAPMPGLGCATQANLAAMLADPRDLLAGSGSDVANAEAPARWVGAYREGRIVIFREDAETVTTGD